ncbi:MAG: chromosomal replication initiator protein DnaA [Candidatus Edwardsbacteria bacterium]|jgi:chromosomal replication initiator protein|nr:chromosomal replication initiator protein DnaA [Candidatus Edwardsbacteria bacterium]
MNQRAQALWAEAGEKIRQRIDPGSYKTWIEPLTVSSIGDSALTLKVPNKFFIDWLEKHYLSFINQAIAEAFQQPLSAVFVAPDDPAATAPRPERPQAAATVQLADDSTLRERYTFDKFVIGRNSEFAYAAAMAVAEAPGRTYNPLFIYGGVGLGKTHLTQAIGNHIRIRKPRTKVLYIPAENFLNELIHSIQNRKSLEFKNKYRSLDVLLIDDVQFLSEKTQSQEEIFHTFNALYESRKQIVLTSDRPPKDIAHLEERLVSRFQSGLVADIQAPDIETRIAILKKKAELDHLVVPGDVLYFIAESVKSNIRELEGCLTRVVGFASLVGRELSTDLAREVLRDIISTRQKTVTIDVIQRTVAGFFSVPEESLRSKKRTKELVHPRQIAMYLSRSLTTASLNDIGSRFGGKDHTTVIHAVAKIQNAVATNAEVDEQVKAITKLIQGG